MKKKNELSTVEYEVLAKLAQCDCDDQKTLRLPARPTAAA